MSYCPTITIPFFYRCAIDRDERLNAFTSRLFDDLKNSHWRTYTVHHPQLAILNSALSDFKAIGLPGHPSMSELRQFSKKDGLSELLQKYEDELAADVSEPSEADVSHADMLYQALSAGTVHISYHLAVADMRTYNFRDSEAVNQFRIALFHRVQDDEKQDGKRLESDSLQSLKNILSNSVRDGLIDAVTFTRAPLKNEKFLFWQPRHDPFYMGRDVSLLLFKAVGKLWQFAINLPKNERRPFEENLSNAVQQPLDDHW